VIRGPYSARIIDVHDGDTIHMDIDLGFGIILAAYNLKDEVQLACRVYGINARELRTEQGKEDFLYARALLQPGDLVTVRSHGWDKFGGRFDGEITMPGGVDFATTMLESGHAVTFKGLHTSKRR
jgi:endonuclease YncB( thermonuclease family)